MTHPEVVKHGVYHSIYVLFNNKDLDPTEMFIGRFESDKEYHLLGYRPKNCSCYFPEESETNQDLGVVSLPKGKKNLAELTIGEKIFIKEQDKNPYSVSIVNLNHSNKLK